ncbi:MAG TPA: transglycosylase family protein [Candidatus Dormibacteraeota bacterium]|nr:transglycosylase family protein [Candidatus Dormibacteraeota bacterium]
MDHLKNGLMFVASLVAGAYALSAQTQHIQPSFTVSAAMAAFDPRAEIAQDRAATQEAVIERARADRAAAIKTAADAAASASANAVGAPPPPPPVSTPDHAAVQAIIQAAFAPQGPDAVSWALRVSACESGYNPNSYNPAGYMGLFQFAPSTWAHTPYGSSSPYDATANANAAAWLYQHSGPNQWGCK